MAHLAVGATDLPSSHSADGHCPQCHQCRLDRSAVGEEPQGLASQELLKCSEAQQCLAVPQTEEHESSSPPMSP